MDAGVDVSIPDAGADADASEPPDAGAEPPDGGADAAGDDSSATDAGTGTAGDAGGM
jgi:hypothetical protein